MSSLDAIREYFARLVSVYRSETGGLPRCEHDPEWTSPCEVGLPSDGGTIAWEPIERVTPESFDDIEAQTGVQLREDAKAWLGRFYFQWHEVKVGRHLVTIGDVWSESAIRDFKKTLVDHLTNELEAGREPSIPIGDFEDGRAVSVLNSSGAVVVEEEDVAPVVLAKSLEEFLRSARVVVTLGDRGEVL